jgi:hypothetical protein
MVAARAPGLNGFSVEQIALSIAHALKFVNREKPQA